MAGRPGTVATTGASSRAGRRSPTAGHARSGSATDPCRTRPAPSGDDLHALSRGPVVTLPRDGGLATGRERAPDRLRRFGLALLSVLQLTGWEPRPAATRVEV